MTAAPVHHEETVSTLRFAQRAKTMKFRDGYLISTGDPKNYYIQEAVRHVAMRYWSSNRRN